ncbi:MAG: hypothetical protein Q7S81_02115 [bacterium]|nr:hypothetical protein [bacterium]
MTNLVLFCVTFVVYFIVSCLLVQPGATDEKQPVLFTVINYAKRAGWVILLCAPFTIMGNVVTVFGNVVSQKNIISLCSIYQKAKGDATALVFSGWQSAGGNAVTGVFSVAQVAGKDSVSGIFAMYQSAKRDVGIGIGFSGYQTARRNAVSPLAGTAKPVVQYVSVKPTPRPAPKLFLGDGNGAPKSRALSERKVTALQPRPYVLPRPSVLAGRP